MSDPFDVLSYRSGALTPTKTYAKRSWLWIPVYRVGHDNLLGRLTIKVQPARTGWGRKIEVDTYLVESDPKGEPGDNGGRAFWLVNVSDPHAEEPYRVVVGGLTPHCGCKAAKCKVPEPCKHAAAMTHLFDAGILDGLDDEQPAEVDEPGIPTRAELDRMAEELGWKRKEMVA